MSYAINVVLRNLPVWRAFLVEIRNAKPGEAAKLTALARKAKSHWPYQDELLSRMLDALEISSTSVRRGIFIVAEEQQRLIGVAGVEHTEHGWELEHLWIDPAEMGKGLGRRLLSEILDQCLTRGLSELTFTSDPHAEGFYERMGANKTGVRASTVIPGRELTVFSITRDSLL